MHKNEGVFLLTNVGGKTDLSITHSAAIFKVISKKFPKAKRSAEEIKKVCRRLSVDKSRRE